MRYATLPISYKLFIKSLAKRKKQDLKNQQETLKSLSKFSSNKNINSARNG